MPSADLFLQYIVAGMMLGALYTVMALGITFIYSIMKMINWSMGEFYMIGSYLQYIFVIYVLGVKYWYLGVLVSAVSVFILGCILEPVVIRPMFGGFVERRTEYATVVTIALMLALRSAAYVLGGPYQRNPQTNLPRLTLGELTIPGERAVAFAGAIIAIALFYGFLRFTWFGLALRAAAQNRVAIQTAGVNIRRLDQLAFGIGVALAGVAGALLAPVFLVYPTNGAITTMKGFEIIIIAGLGSIPGALLGGLILGLVEALCSVLLSPGFQHAYGFLLVLALLLVRPYGLFGEREREV